MPKLSDAITRPYEVKLRQIHELIESIGLSTSVPDFMKVELNNSIAELWKLRLKLESDAMQENLNSQTEIVNPQIDAVTISGMDVTALASATDGYIKAAGQHLTQLVSSVPSNPSKALENKIQLQKEYVAALTNASKQLKNYKKAVDALVAVNEPNSKINAAYPVVGSLVGGSFAFSAMPVVFSATMLKGGLYFSQQANGVGGKAAAFVGGAFFGAIAGIPVSAASLLACGTLGAHVANKHVSDTYHYKANVIYQLSCLGKVLNGKKGFDASFDFWENYYGSLFDAQRPKLRS